MHADSNHPGLRKYRMARARDKERAILRNQIKAANPTFNPKQVEEIVAGRFKMQKV